MAWLRRHDTRPLLLAACLLALPLVLSSGCSCGDPQIVNPPGGNGGAGGFGGAGPAGPGGNGGQGGSGGLFVGCESGIVCGNGACCETGQECVQEACLPDCPSQVRCGPDSGICCNAGDVCLNAACVVPGVACLDWADCAEGEF